ncbi:MAG: hypothetical protein U0172_13115 [Nitrospiraceae bacterium]
MIARPASSLARVFSKYWMLAIIVLASWATSGCPPTPRLFVYNNAGVPVEFMTEPSRTMILSGALLQIGLPNGHYMRANIAGVKVTYYISTFPPEYRKSTYTGFEDVHLQLEVGGAIYLIRPDEVLPATDLSMQPKGFPLLPSEKGAD